MIDIKTAVRAVTDHLESIGSMVPRGEPRLEEFDLDPDVGVWTLTFSFEDVFGSQRIYRTFKVDESGKVLSMKISHAEHEPS